MEIEKRRVGGDNTRMEGMTGWSKGMKKGPKDVGKRKDEKETNENLRRGVRAEERKSKSAEKRKEGGKRRRKEKQI